MLGLQDCIGFSGLSEAHLEALAIHEHLPMAVAADLAECMMETTDGVSRLALILADEVTHSHKRGDFSQESLFHKELCQFVSSHVVDQHCFA